MNDDRYTLIEQSSDRDTPIDQPPDRDTLIEHSPICTLIKQSTLFFAYYSIEQSNNFILFMCNN